MKWCFVLFIRLIAAVTESEILIHLELEGDDFHTPMTALYTIKAYLPESDWDVERVERQLTLLRLPTYVPEWVHELMMLYYKSPAESHALVVSMITARAPKQSLIYTNAELVTRIAIVWYQYCIRFEQDPELEKSIACYPDEITIETGDVMDGWVLSTANVRKYLKTLLEAEMGETHVRPTPNIDDQYSEAEDLIVTPIQMSEAYPSDNSLDSLAQEPDYLTDESLAQTLDELLNKHSNSPNSVADSILD